jgi:hypothetical protein
MIIERPEAERCRKRIEALSIIQSCVDEIGKRSTMAAKAKFVRENVLARFWMVYRSVAMQCNWFDVTKQRICAESTRRN